MGGTSRKCFFIIMIQLMYVVAAQEAIKRTPQGFVGMRGKKLSYTDSTELEHFFKRKPQFFVGVKGKKSYLSSLEQDSIGYKRAPMGFVGMRGKKDFLSEDSDYAENYSKFPRSAGSLIGKIDYATNEDVKNVNFGILREMLDDYVRNINNINSENLLDASQSEESVPYEHITNEVDKRAAGIHQFFGVRGKKSIQDKRPYDLTFRGKFIGVRGKKDNIKNDHMQELKVLLDSGAPWPKRKAQMGFFGMRGKKWTDELSPEEVASN